MPQPVSERIAIVAPSLEAAAVLRYDLIAELSQRGHRVLCLTPPGPAKYMRTLRGLGALHRPIETQPSPLGVLDDWLTIKALVAQFKDWEPNVLLAFGVRILTSAVVAARRANVPRVVAMVNGLPGNGVESLNRVRLGQALRSCDAVIFHNRENADTLANLGLLPPGMQTLVVPGSGVDLATFPATPLPPIDGGLRFLMLARLERHRGVLEYKEAAEHLTASWPTATFDLAGQWSNEPDSISPDLLIKGKVLNFLGPLDDVRPALSACHVFVYPSNGEGMPRAVLEALATGRPVITTRTPGCATTVDEIVSGCLVPPGDAAALAAAMETYLKHPELLESGSRAARIKAERRFDARTVNAKISQILGIS